MDPYRTPQPEPPRLQATMTEFCLHPGCPYRLKYADYRHSDGNMEKRALVYIPHASDCKERSPITHYEIKPYE